MSSRTLYANQITMCVIIIKKKGLLLPNGVAKTSSRLNPDGLGIIWLDTFEVSHHKSNEFKKLHTERPFIAHFRYATVGKVGKSNTHPFRCGAKKDEWLMMNGTIRNLGNHEVCDSRMLAEQIGDVPRHKWKDKLGEYDCRFVTVNTRNRTYQMYNRHLWTERDGIWYSKDNVLERHAIAVYGTLKKGNSNYWNYLSSARYVGKGETEDRYPLVVDGLPFLVDKKGVGHNVEVDVFRVSDSKLKELDRLEGHPTWYERKQVPIKVKGKTICCWVYFNPSKNTDGVQLHKSYTPPTYTHTNYGGSYGNVYTNTYNRNLSWWNDRVDDDYWDSYNNDPCAPININNEHSEFNILEEKPICIECFNDLEYDGFTNYHCNGCGSWFGLDEILTVKE